jgi:DNA-binding transcriptional LysR family regulator
VPQLEDIRAFVEIVETGGFGRAAERLGLSKSIVSRRLGRLEAELGARLLSRTTRGVSPTEAGVELKLRAERILAELDEARDTLAQRGAEIVGTLRLAAPMSFGLRHVAPLLAELAARHPRLRIDAAYSDRFVDLVAERFDAAIRLGTLDDSSLIARRIAPIHAILVASPDYLLRRGRPETPADLVRHEALIQTGRPNGEVWRLRVGQHWTTIRPEGRIRADNGEAILQAAIAGLGVALLPTFLVGPEIESGRLEPLLPDHSPPEAGLYLVRPPGAYVPGKVRALADLLVERFGGEPYWDACQMRRRAEREPLNAESVKEAVT